LGEALANAKSIYHHKGGNDIGLLAGTLFLGMKGEYVEYNPSREHGDEQRQMLYS
jgi:hypothetical protein